MNAKLILTHSYLSECPKRQPRMPRARFVNYYRELFALRNEKVDINTFMQGSQYSYTELGDAVLKQYVSHHNPHEIDLMLLVVWSHEFDPDYASCTAYFSHQYHIDAEIVDVCDNGILGIYSAFHLLKKYIDRSNMNVALMLVLEQVSIPTKNQFKYFPRYDFGFALRIEKRNENELNNQLVLVNSSISSRIESFGINIHSHQGCYELANVLHQYVHQSNSINACIIQQDCESENIGYLQLRRAS